MRQIIDVEGSTIQNFFKEGKEIIVYNDYDIGAVVVKSKVDMPWGSDFKYISTLKRTKDCDDISIPNNIRAAFGVPTRCRIRCCHTEKRI